MEAQLIPEAYTLLKPRLRGDDDCFSRLGPFYVKPIPGGISVAIRLEPRHCNPFHEAHGGFVSAMADVALSFCLLRSPQAPASVATLELSAHYLDSPKLGDWLEAHARPERMGRSIGFASSEFFVGDRKVVNARGTFKLLSAASLQRRLGTSPSLSV